jgi:SAM-dependent methyltransferase
MTCSDFSSTDNTLVNRFFSFVQENHLYSSRRNFEFYLEYLFGNIPLNGKSILDIGGGIGLFSFYAGCKGAKEVLCLEPEAAGSTSRVGEKFRGLQEALPELAQVRLVQQPFQEVAFGESTFDLVLLHDSINHLDESACITLLEEEASLRTYTQLFSKISRLCRACGKLIITDCSRHNLFSLLRVKNPFGPSLEWHKHQSPYTWSRLLSAQGFTLESIRWASPNRLGRPGRLFLGNKLCAFCITSMFCLKMQKH